MRRLLPVIMAAVIACLAAAPVPPVLSRSGPPVVTLEQLLDRVHLYGCQVRQHPPDDQHECVMLRRAILAAAQRGALMARHEAFRQAAAVVRTYRSTKAAADALDRRASD